MLPVLMEEPALPQRQWEYELFCAEEQTADDLFAKLNELGAQGWELVVVREASGDSKSFLVFKRQKVQELRRAE